MVINSHCLARIKACADWVCLFLVIVQLYRLERYNECKSVYTDLIRNSQDEYEEERKTNLAAVVAAMSQWESTPLVKAPLEYLLRHLDYVSFVYSPSYVVCLVCVWVFISVLFQINFWTQRVIISFHQASFKWCGHNANWNLNLDLDLDLLKNCLVNTRQISVHLFFITCDFKMMFYVFCAGRSRSSWLDVWAVLQCCLHSDWTRTAYRGLQ